MVLVEGSLLEQHLAFLIENEHGEGSMQNTLLVGFEFFHLPHFQVLFIDQYYLFHTGGTKYTDDSLPLTSFTLNLTALVFEK
jgi:hypothetical protein